MKPKCPGGSSLASAAVQLQWWLRTQMPRSKTEINVPITPFSPLDKHIKERFTLRHHLQDKGRKDFLCFWCLEKGRRGKAKKVNKSIVGHSFTTRLLPAFKNANALFYDPKTNIIIWPKMKPNCSGGGSLTSAAVHLQLVTPYTNALQQNVWSNYQKCMGP
ncbi:hypothetical protein CDAR_602261 [Caerostris darwini]|uniref:Uncharacterized protein n=1 Tax=Caerostris darwini TaxID=1538125 RepID=A0AAV4NAK1_9ARAC|nr:hypothetical protein CDAR_602261 [Caerostris darwini]